MRTNAPKLITMALSIVLTIAGLHLTGTVEIGFVGELLDQVGAGGLGKDEGFIALLASPVLLIAASFLPNL